MEAKVKIRKTIKGHEVGFKIDNQTFYLGELLPEEGMTSYKYAQWYKGCLETAFKKLHESYASPLLLDRISDSEIETDIFAILEDHGINPMVAPICYDAIMTVMRDRLGSEGWISVEDRLPEKRKIGSGERSPILVATEEGNVFATTYTGLGWANLYNQTVTHWQPLPKPPNKEEKI